jgi:Adenine-specific methyltransferase EcoRI
MSTIALPANRMLASAKAARQDEFYTQLSDIENELRHYKAHMRGKTVLCNCDDPFESNFFKYFALNFNTLGLKKLICTSYERSAIAGRELLFQDYAGYKPNGKQARLVEINAVPDLNADGAIDLFDVEHLLRHDANASRRLYEDGTYGGGDFRSSACVEVLEQADIVVTNPPFSLFREYLAQLVQHEKQFLIIGNKNIITYKEVFKLIKEDKLWIGVTPMGVDLLFDVPEEVAQEMIKSGKEGSNYKIVNGKVKGRSTSAWFTNLEHNRRHELIPLYKKYTPDEYQSYDNYDAVEVGQVAKIPVDYQGTMGVPITFLDKYNPDQFEILGLAASAGYDPEIVGLAKHPGFKDARPLIAGKNTYARIYVKRKG